MKYCDFNIDGVFRRFTDTGLIIFMGEANATWDALEGLGDRTVDNGDTFDELSARLERLERRIETLAQMLASRSPRLRLD